MVPKDKGPWAIVVPFTLPGEKVRVRIGKNDRMHSTGEVLELLTHNPDLRDNSRIKCKYFGTCAGCQYQVSFSFLFFFFQSNLFSGGTFTDIFITDAVCRNSAGSEKGCYP